MHSDKSPFLFITSEERSKQEKINVYLHYKLVIAIFKKESLSLRCSSVEKKNSIHLEFSEYYFLFLVLKLKLMDI